MSRFRLCDFPYPDDPESHMNIREPYLYGSHLPILLECVMKTEGPILEIGAGAFSTPILSSICKINNRHLVTVESSTGFHSSVFGGTNHWWFQLLEPALAHHPKFDVIFVDGLFPRELAPLKGRGKLIVVHDTNDPQYNFDFSLFTAVRHYKDLHPWTSVLSDEINLLTWEPL